MTKSILVGLALILSIVPALGGELPAACGAAPATPAPAGSSSSGMNMPGMKMGGSDGARTALMAGMDEMDADMMRGARAEDIDVAFLCSMIPHHRGAIAMAKAELASGDDPWSRELAQNIIAAQEKEIADMTAQLEALAK